MPAAVLPWLVDTGLPALVFGLLTGEAGWYAVWLDGLHRGEYDEFEI